jgi:hypothetical protein
MVSQSSMAGGRHLLTFSMGGRRHLLTFAALMLGLCCFQPSTGLTLHSAMTSRRGVLRSLGSGATAAALLNNKAAAPVALAADKAETPEEKEKREKLLREKIEASKKSYRKADSYVSERFKTVDYR